MPTNAEIVLTEARKARKAAETIESLYVRPISHRANWTAVSIGWPGKS